MSPRRAVHSQDDPVLLALPPRRIEGPSGPQEPSGEALLEQLQVIETGCGPRVEAALLMELLSRSPSLEKSLVDPAEVHSYHNPLAAVNAYKHRLHALRCEFVNVRLLLHERETQLNQSRYRNEVLEKHVQFLDATLEEMRASRAWKWVEKCSRWRRIAAGWSERFCHLASSLTSGKR
ncbi:MAG: hypothetical protein ACRELG_03950 [Gemmataceae bacterium]